MVNKFCCFELYIEKGNTHSNVALFFQFDLYLRIFQDFDSLHKFVNVLIIWHGVDAAFRVHNERFHISFYYYGLVGLKNIVK